MATETSGGNAGNVGSAALANGANHLPRAVASVMAWFDRGFTRMGWITEYRGFHLNACYLRFPEKDVQSAVSSAIRRGNLTLPATH